MKRTANETRSNGNSPSFEGDTNPTKIRRGESGDRQASIPSENVPEGSRGNSQTPPPTGPTPHSLGSTSPSLGAAPVSPPFVNTSSEGAAQAMSSSSNFALYSQATASNDEPRREESVESLASSSPPQSDPVLRGPLATHFRFDFGRGLM